MLIVRPLYVGDGDVRIAVAGIAIHLALDKQWIRRCRQKSYSLCRAILNA